MKRPYREWISQQLSQLLASLLICESLWSLIHPTRIAEEAKCCRGCIIKVQISWRPIRSLKSASWWERAQPFEGFPAFSECSTLWEWDLRSRSLSPRVASIVWWLPLLLRLANILGHAVHKASQAFDEYRKLELGLLQLLREQWDPLASILSGASGSGHIPQ